MGQTATTARHRRWAFILLPVLVAVPLVALLHPWTHDVHVTPLAGRLPVPPPATTEVDGATLRLNGAGIRWALNWEAYVVSLYVPAPVHRARDVLDGTGPARLVLDVKRPIERQVIERAFRSGVERAAGAHAGRVVAELAPFFALLRDVRKDEQLVITWRRGTGLDVAIGDTRATVPGDAPARAVFGIWLGQAPVDPVLRAELLDGTP